MEDKLDMDAFMYLLCPLRHRQVGQQHCLLAALGSGHVAL